MYFKNGGKDDMVNKSDGFTLMELMTVLVIIGIAAAIAIPNVGGWFAKKDMDSAIREMFSNFLRARSEAITNFRPFKIWVDRTNNLYLIVDSKGDSPIAQVGLPQGVSFGRCTFPVSATYNTAGIDQRGFSTLGVQGAIEIISARAANNNDMAIVLDPGGSARIVNRGEAGWPW